MNVSNATDIYIVPRTPKWPVRLEPAGPPTLRKVVRDTSPSTTEQAMEPHPIADMECHPIADLFPMISEEDLTALAADIKANGLIEPIITFEGKILDGRHRFKACLAAGVDPVFQPFVGERDVKDDRHKDPLAFVISKNLYRRHLTAAQKGKLLKELLKSNPERSDRATAALAQVSDKTVGTVRKELEASAEIPRLTERTGADGKKRKQAVKKATPADAPTPAAEPKQTPAEEPKAPEQPKVVATDDLRSWIDLKPALPMSELFAALWDCMSGAEQLNVYELVSSDEWRSARPPARDHRPQQNSHST